MRAHRPFLAGLVLLACFASGVQAQPSPRRPRGIYAVVDVADQITKWTEQYPEITEAQLASGFATLYSDLLLNPAISGLAIQIHWDTLEPSDPRNYDNPYDWSYLQPAFDAIQQSSAFSAKTIQLIVAPVFQSPGWLFDELNPSFDADIGRRPVQHEGFNGSGGGRLPERRAASAGPTNGAVQDRPGQPGACPAIRHLHRSLASQTFAWPPASRSCP
jgi:hypothetical protein